MIWVGMVFLFFGGFGLFAKHLQRRSPKEHISLQPYSHYVDGPLEGV